MLGGAESSEGRRALLAPQTPLTLRSRGALAPLLVPDQARGVLKGLLAPPTRCHIADPRQASSPLKRAEPIHSAEHPSAAGVQARREGGAGGNRACRSSGPFPPAYDKV